MHCSPEPASWDLPLITDWSFLQFFEDYCTPFQLLLNGLGMKTDQTPPEQLRGEGGGQLTLLGLCSVHGGFLPGMAKDLPCGTIPTEETSSFLTGFLIKAWSKPV